MPDGFVTAAARREILAAAQEGDEQLDAVIVFLLRCLAELSVDDRHTARLADRVARLERYCFTGFDSKPNPS